MKNHLRILIITIVTLTAISCRNSSSLFTNERLNECFGEFITESGEYPAYQVILGSNSRGIKVDFIAISLYLDGPLYWYEPNELELIGYYTVANSMVSVYGCKGDNYSSILTKGVLRKDTNETEDPLGDKVRSHIVSYQVLQNGVVEESVSKEYISSPKYYRISPDRFGMPADIILFDENQYVSVMGHAVAMGTYQTESDSSVVLTPNQVFCYSRAKDEMIPYPMDQIPGLLNGDVREFLLTRHFSF